MYMQYKIIGPVRENKNTKTCSLRKLSSTKIMVHSYRLTNIRFAPLALYCLHSLVYRLIPFDLNHNNVYKRKRNDNAFAGTNASST